MKNLFCKILVCLALVGYSDNVSAQGFLKGLMKKTETKTDSKEQTSSDTTQVKSKINAKDIPAYKAQLVYVTDGNGQRVKNEDGTDKYIVELIRTSDGTRVSPEAAQEQSKQINKAILAIAAKAGIATGIGALQGGGKGALVGLAAGLGLSVEDIILIVKLKKDINKQKKALEVYRQSFDEEGNPTTAKIDSKTLKTLGISEENAVEKSTAQIQEELSRPEYTNLPQNESIDALLEAATKTDKV